MVATVPANRENIVSLSDVRAERRLSPLSLEMDFSESQRDSIPVGRTVWFAVAVSLAMWALIAGAIWLV